MKKILFTTLVFIFSIFTFTNNVLAGDCTFDPIKSNIDGAMDKCLENTKLVETGNVEIGGGFSTMITKWTDNIALYLGILAVLAIGVGAFMMVFSAGEDEKITKAKNTVKWGILGFIGVLAASTIINLIVKVIYSL